MTPEASLSLLFLLVSPRTVLEKNANMSATTTSTVEGTKAQDNPTLVSRSSGAQQTTKQGILVPGSTASLAPSEGSIKPLTKPRQIGRTRTKRPPLDGTKGNSTLNFQELLNDKVQELEQVWERKHSTGSRKGKKEGATSSKEGSSMHTQD
jgi:hypothetical protein